MKAKILLFFMILVAIISPNVLAESPIPPIIKLLLQPEKIFLYIFYRSVIIFGGLAIASYFLKDYQDKIGYGNYKKLKDFTLAFGLIPLLSIIFYFLISSI